MELSSGDAEKGVVIVGVGDVGKNAGGGISRHGQSGRSWWRFSNSEEASEKTVLLALGFNFLLLIADAVFNTTFKLFC